MYNTLNNIDQLLRDGTKFCIENDRRLYVVVFECIEQFAIDNELIVGGVVGTNLLLQQYMFEESAQPYIYDLYCDDTFNKAKLLADTIYLKLSKIKTHLDHSTIYVESKIKHKLFTIWIEARPVANVHAYDRYRDVKLLELFEPVKARPEFVDKSKFIKCMNAMSLLIQIYQKLYLVYTSKKTRTYSEMLVIEQRLYDIFTKDIKVVGGGKGKSAEETLSRIFSDITAAVMKNFDDKTVIIGDVAVAALNGDTKLNTRRRLQILTSEDPQNIKIMIEGVIKNLYKDGKFVNMQEYDLKLPTDMLLRKYTYTIVHGDYRQQVLEVFNSPSYELIPTITIERRKYASWFCLMRFRLVDIVAAMLMSKLHGANENRFAAIIDRYKESLDQLRTEVYKQIHENPLKVWSTDPNNYVGAVIEENIIMKKLTADTKYQFTKYYSHLKFLKSEPLDKDLVEEGEEANEDSED